MRFAARIETLEKRWRGEALASQAEQDSRTEKAAAQEAKLEEAWAIMRTTMSEEHARIVEKAYPKGRWAIYGTPEGRLLNRCLEAIARPDGWWDSHWAFKGVRPEVALAMPPLAAQVYLDHPDAMPLNDCCEACGYRVPVKYFEACPLCGGRVGWYAYHRKRTAESPPEALRE